MSQTCSLFLTYGVFPFAEFTLQHQAGMASPSRQRVGVLTADTQPGQCNRLQQQQWTQSGQCNRLQQQQWTQSGQCNGLQQQRTHNLVSATGYNNNSRHTTWSVQRVTTTTTVDTIWSVQWVTTTADTQPGQCNGLQQQQQTHNLVSATGYNNNRGHNLVSATGSQQL